jgi:hypothetical protein
MSALKIGVLTFHRCINYGSYWQARALVEGLRARGHDAVILDHHSDRVNIAEWKCAFQPVLPTHVPESDHPLYREKIENFFTAFDSLPFSRSFNIERPFETERYDTIVVGSDEVWNLFHPWYGRYPLFYGDGLRADRLISYAASFGNYPAEWGLDEQWSRKLANFSAISVRDENSQWLVKNAVGFEPEIVLDPCLQFDIDPDDRFNKYAPNSYVAVYGHNFSTSFINEIQAWAKANCLPLISIGYRNDWADEQWITADPHDFAHFISNASVVATNFFHGCVFALKYQKPFVCETSPYRSNKLQGLMAKVNGEKHLVTEETSPDVYNEVLSAELHPSILEKINELRQASNRYLDRALDHVQFQAA